MLPEDSANSKVAALEAAQQGRVDEHFEIIKPSDKPIPYSDSIFRDVAIQWLIQTDQVCSLFLMLCM
jgi:hypothetical protein